MADYVDLPELKEVSELMRNPQLSALAKSGNDLNLKSFANVNLEFISQYRQADEYIGGPFGGIEGLRKSYTESNEEGSLIKTYSWVGTERSGSTRLTGWSHSGELDLSSDSNDTVSYRNTILTTPSGMIRFAEREYRRTSINDDGEITGYWFGNISTASSIDEGSEVRITPEERLAVLIDEGWAAVKGADMPESLGSVRLKVWWYPAIDRDGYYDVVPGGEGRDSGTGAWGTRPSLYFDQDKYDADVKDRTDSLDSSIESERGRLADDEAELSQLQSELQQLQSSAASDNESDWQDDVNEWVGAITEYGELGVRRNKKLMKLHGDEELTDEEKDQLQAEIDDLYFQMQGVLYGSYGASYNDWANQTILNKQRQVDRKKEDIAVKQAEIDSRAACRDAIQGSPDKDHYYIAYWQTTSSSVAGDNYDDGSFSPLTGNWYNKGRTKWAGRYKILVEGPVDLRAGSEVDIQWAEITQPDYIRDITANYDDQGEVEDYEYDQWHPNPTREYKKDTLSLEAGQSEVATGWIEVTAPPIGTWQVRVGAPFYFQPDNESYGRGIQVKKDGIYGYEPSEPPKIYRKEVWSGGHGGCSESDLDPVDYDWEIGDLTSEEQQNLGDYNAPPSIYRRNPRTRGYVWFDPDPVIDGSKLPESSMNSRTWLDTKFKCGDDEVQHTFKTELVEELKTDDLKEYGDDFVEEYLSWREAWQAGSAESGDRPLPWEYGAQGYAVSYLQDFDTYEIFSQLLDGRIIGEKIVGGIKKGRGAIQAINFLSSDETLYLKKSVKWRSELHGRRANLPDAIITLKFTRYTMDLDTHEVTAEEQTRTITAVQIPEDNPPFDYKFQMEYERLDAPSQSFVVLADFYVSVDGSNWGTANSVYDNQVLFAGGDPQISDVRLI